jgi:hypothetical protein
VDRHHQAGLSGDQLRDAVLEDWTESAAELDECIYRVHLLAGPAVQGALKDYTEWWYQSAMADWLLGASRGEAIRGWTERERPLLDAMRKEVQADFGLDD